MPRRMLQGVFVLSVYACLISLPASGWAAPAPKRFQLRVSLYPWIPNATSFFQWIETDFEAKHPDIDLVVRPLAKSFGLADLAYEPDQTAAALTDERNPDFQHLVELDTLILGALAQRGAIAPFAVQNARFLPAAAEAVTWNNQTVGVPHWTCGYFVISEDPTIRTATNIFDLVSILSAQATPRVDLAGDLANPWDAITGYLDAFRDTYPRGDLQQAVTQPGMDPDVKDYLSMLQSACSKDGVSYCGADAVDLFATGNADALIGYSERLNPILAHAKKTVGTLHVASATLGDGDAPALFTDALVLSPRCSSLQCQSAAQRFATYYVSDAVFEVALMALDAGLGSVPRYLLPSTTSAFEYGLVGTDRLYGQLKEEIKKGRPFPNNGVLEAQESGILQQEMKEALGL